MLQLEIARLGPRAPGHGARVAASERLLLAHRDAWQAPLRAVLPGDPGRVQATFREGFPYRLALDHQELQHLGASITARAPVREFVLRLPRQGGGAFRHADRVTLWLGGPAQTAAALHDEDVAHLTGLTIDEIALGARRTMSLLDRLDQGALTALHLRGVQPGRSGLRALASGRLVARLEELGLRASGLRAADLALLLDRAPAADTWDLSANPALVGALGEVLAPHVGRIRRLQLRGSYAPADLARLAHRATGFDALHAASPRGRLEPRHVAAVGRLDVASLGLGNAQLTSDALRALCDGGLPRVSTLSLRTNRLGDAGVSALTRTEAPELTALDLSSNQISSKGAAELSQWPGLRHVIHLNLGNNRRIGPDGAEHLLRAPHLAPTSLWLQGCGLSEAWRDRLEARFGPHIDLAL